MRLLAALVVGLTLHSSRLFPTGLLALAFSGRGLAVGDQQYLNLVSSSYDDGPDRSPMYWDPEKSDVASTLTSLVDDKVRLERAQSGSSARALLLPA